MQLSPKGMKVAEFMKVPWIWFIPGSILPTRVLTISMEPTMSERLTSSQPFRHRHRRPNLQELSVQVGDSGITLRYKSI